MQLAALSLLRPDLLLLFRVAGFRGSCFSPPDELRAQAGGVTRRLGTSLCLLSGSEGYLLERRMRSALSSKICF